MDEEVPDQYDPQAVEDTVSAYWDDHDAYERTKAVHADDPPFFFIDGPPYTSGQMHLGTAWNKTLKDSVIRRKRMEGYRVTDRPGYDMHGLPIETKVEQELGFESKQDIEDYGMEQFIEECKQFAVENRENMDEDFQSIGVWMDWENPYQTISPEYMESAWWAFSQANENGLVEQGKRSITQCPRCETAIAKNEVEYHQVEDPSIYVGFPLANREGSLVAWTTTPWTVPANTFVAVDEDATYAKVRAEHGGEADVLYIATECVDDVLAKGDYDEYGIEAEMPGEDLIGWHSSAGNTTTPWPRKFPITPPSSAPARCTTPTTSRPTERGWSTPRLATDKRTSRAATNSGWTSSVRLGATVRTTNAPGSTPASSSATPTRTSLRTSAPTVTCLPTRPTPTTTGSAGAVTRTSSSSRPSSGSSPSPT